MRGPQRGAVLIEFIEKPSAFRVCKAMLNNVRTGYYRSPNKAQDPMLIHFICRVRAGINPAPTAKPINTDAGVDFFGGELCSLFDR